MGKIVVLDKKTVDQIAAGEVVERPSSVVKELVENAIDAGAHAISIEIKDGGASLIRITDDGCGIDPEDIPAAFTAHATSKLRQISDLEELTTLGFRGEALASIAAVSRVELITKRAEDLTAIRIRLDGGVPVHEEEIGAPDGTTIIVRDLFFNVPARAKFLKSAMTEASYVGAFAEQLALSRPDISFSFTVNGQRKLQTSGKGSLHDVIHILYGREMSREILEVNASDPELGLSLSGYIGKPVMSRGNRTLEMTFVNGRSIRSKILMKAIEDGFGTRLMQHRYPFSCLMLTLDGKNVDVNVHPSKIEVRFVDENGIYEAVRRAVAKALDHVDMIVSAKADSQASGKKAQTTEKVAGAEPFEKKERERLFGRTEKGRDRSEADKVMEKASYGPGPDAVGRETEPENTESPDRTDGTAFSEDNEAGQKTGPVQTVRSETDPSGESKTEQSGLPGAEKIEEKDRDADRQTDTLEKTEEKAEEKPLYEQMTLGFLTEEGRKQHRIIGEVFRTYWLVEFEEKLFIIDQHAAHEKVLYEKLMKSYKERSLTSQMITPPILVSLSLQEEAAYLEHREAFEKLGFEIEAFGGRDYLIRGLPYTLEAYGSKELFLEMLDASEGPSTSADTLEAYTHRVATEACKAAVKGNNRLTLQEADYLIDQLLGCEDPYHCPHGRPTIIAFSKYDLEKRFKRIV